MSTATYEIEAGERFEFGENWRRFLATVDEDRITGAVDALREMLGTSSLAGRSFLDAGSGSGLSSLAAWRLGASIMSFDFDPSSVDCTDELRSRFSDGTRWSVAQGSVLDVDFLEGLGRFDVVYSWGVLHHSGDMWAACAKVVDLVAPGGQLFISIYNDQGRASRVWRRIKQTYNESDERRRRVIVGAADLYFRSRGISWRTYRLITRQPRSPAAVRPRGMDRRHDLVDWVGGYPFEVAKPEEVFDFFHARGFELERLTTCGGGLGCNQFVLRRS